MTRFVDLLELETIGTDRYQSKPQLYATGRLYGGEVMGQALLAAKNTVVQPFCHSLHCYFMAQGDAAGPTQYQVERSRDGRSFSTRRVTASQRGRQIFNMICSFQGFEDGPDHNDSMPSAPSPELVLDVQVLNRDVFKRGDNVEPYERQPWFELRPIEAVNPLVPTRGPTDHRAWLRFKEALDDDITLNQAALVFASDYTLAATAWRPHGVSPWTGLQTSSLDHAIWFHRPTTVGNWHLYVHHSPSAFGARGFSTGTLYREDGVLVASVAQESLMRWR